MICAIEMTLAEIFDVNQFFFEKNNRKKTINSKFDRV